LKGLAFLTAASQIAVNSQNLVYNGAIIVYIKALLP
jgi:hypothetical protein